MPELGKIDVVTVNNADGTTSQVKLRTIGIVKTNVPEVISEPSPEPAPEVAPQP